MSPRVTRHFNMFYVPLVATSSMKTIFESILTGFLSDGFSEAHAAIALQLVDASVELYQTITKELRPTPSKSHYTFNLRDLAKVVQGMLQIVPGHYTAASLLCATVALLPLCSSLLFITFALLYLCCLSAMCYFRLSAESDSAMRCLLCVRCSALCLWAPTSTFAFTCLHFCLYRFDDLALSVPTHATLPICVTDHNQMSLYT